MADVARLTLKLARPDQPQGEFWCTRLDEGGIRIDHADPRILISAELLDIVNLRGFSSAWLDMTGCITPADRAAPYVGAVLRIDGVNQQVVYRIVDYAPRNNSYVGEWPD